MENNRSKVSVISTKTENGLDIKCISLNSNLVPSKFDDSKLTPSQAELAPDYLQCLFTQRNVNDYNLRNLEGKLSMPKPNTNYLKRSFCYSGACLWNNVPQDLKSVCSIGQFKQGIKKVSEISDSHTAVM